MAKSKYLTAPVPSTTMPGGIPYIISNEAAERFSFYGMKCILVIFMIKYLMGRDGGLDVMNEAQAKEWYHLFTSAVYFTPILGALLCDIFLGKYKTIILLSIVYCLGHLALALDDTRLGLAIGLGLITLGAGGIKPCVSAHVGDQFGKTNQHLLERVFGWFYFSINFGSFISTIMTPWLLEAYGPHVAFGVPGGLMLLATIFFWMGRNKFIHIPASGFGFVKETFSGDGLKALAKLGIIFIFVAPFWALFDQTGSAWVLQAEKMDRHWLGLEWLSSQIQAINPLMIMIFIPIFSFVIYPAINKVFTLTPLRKIAIGLFVGAGAFVVSALIEARIEGGDVVKVSSRSRVQTLSPAALIDGETGGLGWSSDGAPTPRAPEEAVIRLRERGKWTLSQIEIDPATTLTVPEIVDMLEVLSLEALQELKQLKEQGAAQEERDALEQKASALRAAAQEAGQAAAPEAKQIAAKALAQTGAGPEPLEDARYFPREVSVYAADLTGRFIPQLASELEEADAKLDDVKQLTEQNGWTHLGDLMLAADGAVGRLEFAPTAATHVLVQVRSNHGAGRVKIAEVKALADDPPPVGANGVTAAIWPNVAAIGFKPNIIWQLLAYMILTAGEVLVSITCLEFAYTQAPRKMKSALMSLYLLSISLGNIFTAFVNHFIQNEDGSTKLEGASYYWFFTIIMFVTALCFLVVAKFYRVKTYIQDEGEAT